MITTAPAVARQRPTLESGTDPEGRVYYRFTLPGAPKTKKTSNRVLRMGKRNMVLPSKAWIEWRDACQEHVDDHPELKLELARPVNMAARFYREALRGDLSGYVSGVCDVLQEIGAVVNDAHITQFDGTRLEIDRTNPRTEILLTLLPWPNAELPLDFEVVRPSPFTEAR